MSNVYLDNQIDREQDLIHALKFSVRTMTGNPTYELSIIIIKEQTDHIIDWDEYDE